MVTKLVTMWGMQKCWWMQRLLTIYFMKDILGRDINEGQYVAHTNDVSWLKIYKIIKVGKGSYTCETLTWWMGGVMSKSTFRWGQDLILPDTMQEIEYEGKKYRVRPHEFNWVDYMVQSIISYDSSVTILNQWEIERRQKIKEALEVLLTGREIIN